MHQVRVAVLHSCHVSEFKTLSRHRYFAAHCPVDSYFKDYFFTKYDMMSYKVLTLIFEFLLLHVRELATRVITKFYPSDNSLVHAFSRQHSIQICINLDEWKENCLNLCRKHSLVKSKDSFRARKANLVCRTAPTNYGNCSTSQTI